MRMFLERMLPNAKALEGARLTFVQLLAIVRSLQPVGADEWHWDAVGKLNRLRNQLSHHLEPKERDATIDEYVGFVVKRLGKPLPHPAAAVGAVRPPGEPMFQAVDMVNGALYGLVTAWLRLLTLEGPQKPDG